MIVLGLMIDANVIRTLTSYLDFESEQLYQKSIKAIVERYVTELVVANIKYINDLLLCRHQRHKKYLMEICDEIYEHKSKRTNPTLIFYSISDSFYKLII